MRQPQYPNPSSPPSSSSPSSSSEAHRLRPIDYSRYLSDGTEWIQGLCGLITFFIAYAGWYPVARRLPAVAIVEGPRDAWIMQLGWAAVCLAALLVVDLLARSRWGWDRFRVGLVLGLSAVAGFWIVRLAMSWPPAAA